MIEARYHPFFHRLSIYPVEKKSMRPLVWALDTGTSRSESSGTDIRKCLYNACINVLNASRKVVFVDAAEWTV